jgi:hypothetical protein
MWGSLSRSVAETRVVPCSDWAFSVIRLANSLGVDRVDPLGAELAQEGGQQGRGEHRAVVIGDLAQVLDLQLGGRSMRDLGVEASDPIGHLEVGAQGRHVLGQHHRRVERETGQAAV